MQALELLRSLRGFNEQQRLAERYGGAPQLTGCGFWLWRPPTEEAWEAYMADRVPVAASRLAEFTKTLAQPNGPCASRAPSAEPEEDPRERRRRERIAKRDKRIIWA